MIPVLSWSGYPDISLQGKLSPDFRFDCRLDSPVLRKYTLFPQVSARPHSHNRSGYGLEAEGNAPAVVISSWYHIISGFGVKKIDAQF